VVFKFKTIWEATRLGHMQNVESTCRMLKETGRKRKGAIIRQMFENELNMHCETIGLVYL